MAVKLRKLRGKYYLVIDHQGKRTKRAVGTDEKLAKDIRRKVEAKLTLKDFGLLAAEQEFPTFAAYAETWMKEYAWIECKTSTAQSYAGILRQYLNPRFARKPLNEIKRDDLKAMINALVRQGLSRNTIRNTLCVVRAECLMRQSRPE